jgi:hypothetical protein
MKPSNSYPTQSPERKSSKKKSPPYSVNAAMYWKNSSKNTNPTPFYVSGKQAAAQSYQ